MALSNAMVSVIIVLVIVASFGSLVYPSVNSPFYSTQTIINTSTYRQTLGISYAVSSYGISYYYQTTSSQNYFPDWASCSGQMIGPFPPCYYLIWATSTKTLSTPFTVTSTSTTYTTATSEQAYTNWSIQTQYQRIPLFAAIGLSGSQFTIIALLIIVIGGLAIFYARNRSKKTYVAD